MDSNARVQLWQDNPGVNIMAFCSRRILESVTNSWYCYKLLKEQTAMSSKRPPWSSVNTQSHKQKRRVGEINYSKK